MDVRGKIEKLIIRFDWHRPEGTLEKMASLFILCVEVFCITCLHPLQISGDAPPCICFFLDEKVKVIRHYGKGGQPRVFLSDNLLQTSFWYLKL